MRWQPFKHWREREHFARVRKLLSLPESCCTLCWLLALALIGFLLFRVFRYGGSR